MQPEVDSAVQPLDPTVPPQPVKTGIATTEFWIALGVVLSGLGVQVGFVNSAEITAITSGWSQAMTAIFTLVVQLGTAATYIYARYQLKTAHLNAEVAVVKAEVHESKLKPRSVSSKEKVMPTHPTPSSPSPKPTTPPHEPSPKPTSPK